MVRRRGAWSCGPDEGRHIDEEFAEKDRATNRSRRIKGVQPVLFEYACSPNSNLSKVAQEVGVRAIRLSRDSIDLADSAQVDQLQGQITQTEGADILMSLPCTYHSQWQAMNVYKGGRSYARKLKANREWVESMLLSHCQSCKRLSTAMAA